MAPSTPSRRQQPRFVVLLPVKPAAVAKSRLLGLGDSARRRLVGAFAADTAAAALETDQVAAVLAVSSDVELAGQLARLGAQVVSDSGSVDLNGALRLASEEARRRWPGMAVAALCADLPALRSAELGAALAAASAEQVSFVADADEVGTTMLAAATSELFTPRFGPQSRKAHVDSGALELRHLAAPGLRRDVDTPEDLQAATRLGLGPRTAEVTADLRL